MPATVQSGGAVDVPIGFTPQPAVTVVQPLPTTVIVQQPSPTPFVGQPLPTLTPFPVQITWTPLPLTPLPQGTPIVQVPTVTPIFVPTTIPTVSTPIVVPTAIPTTISQQPPVVGQVQVIDPQARVKPFCNDATLPGPVNTPADDNTLRAAYETLLGINVDEVQNGYNALYLSDLRVDSVSIQGDVATVQLSGEMRVLETGDVCAATRMYNQLVQTALAFPNINNVVITINGQPINEALEIL